MFRKSLLGFFLLGFSGSLGAQSALVKDEHDLVFARMIGNYYSWLTVVANATGPGTFTCSEKMFDLMPQLTVLNQPTLDENESRIRLFADPQIRCLDAKKSEDKSVRRWEVQDLKDGLGLTPVNAAAMPVKAKVRIQPSAELSIITVTAELANPSSQDHTVECRFPFYGKMPGITPPQVLIPHTVNRFRAVNGKVEKSQVVQRDLVVLDGNAENYWWRKQIDAKMLRKLNNTIREEKIPFGSPKMKVPDYFTVSGMVGDSILIFHQMQEMTQLELMWQAAVMRITPVLKVTVPPKGSKTVSFRLLLGKGISRIDNVTEHFVSAYTVQENALELSLLPLEVIRQITLDVVLHSSADSVIATRSFEVQGMSPFEPWKGTLPLNSSLQSTGQYPIKLRLNDTLSAKRLYELENIIVP